MVKIREVDANEVKRVFLLADGFKGDASKHKEISGSELEERFLRLKESLWALSEEELNEGVIHKVRLNRFNEMTWYFSSEPLYNMGVFPKMKHLDIHLTTGNVLSTMRGVKRARDFNLGGVPEKFCGSLDSVRDLSEFIYERFPLILISGGEEREIYYNAKSRENGDPLCTIYDFDIDDGSTRSVAYAFEGLEEAPVFVGKR